MKIKGVIFDVGQTLSNQLDKERLVERNKKYYAYVHQEILNRGLASFFPNLLSYSQSDFVEDLNTLNLFTRSEKNKSTEVLTEYRMSEQTLDILLKYEEKSGCSLDKLKVREQVLSVLDQIYSGTDALDEGVYELWPDTREVLISLREQGYVLGLASNTAHPVKHEHMLARLGITPLIDHFAVSSYIGVRKPNPEMVKNLLQKMNLTEKEVVVVGDLLDRDVLMGNLAGAKTVWINAIPYSLEQNLKRIKEKDAKYRPSAGIVCLSQLPGTIDYLDKWQNSGQVRVGYYFPSLRKKLETGKQKAFVSNERVVYMPVELRAPIEGLGEFDVFVHKVTDLLLSDDATAKEGLSYLDEYIATHPEVVVLDPVQSLEFTNYRSKLREIWPEITAEGVRVRCPDLYMRDQVVFPCIVKTDIACQVESSHDMVIAVDKGSLEDALAKFSIKTIIQEWVDHVAMFKVYILGDYYQITPAKVIKSQSVLSFNSTKIPQQFEVNHSLDPSPQVIQLINQTLKDVTRLGLISYDLAVSTAGEYVIVDLNYFPGYYSVENYPQLMDEYVLKAYRDRKLIGKFS